MTTKDEIENIRRRLMGELAKHQEAIQQIKGALDALNLVGGLLESELQVNLPGAGPYANLGPEELALRIIGSEDREWSISQIIKEAEMGGKNLANYKSAYPVFYTALTRLVKKGEAMMLRRDNIEPGEKWGTYFRRVHSTQREGDPEVEDSGAA